ncbi:potassium channel family protein [Mycobacterium sp. E2699]|uniref:potassium channel family protein n=1 Tax=Mycobacterium sp. E2699 TaxID=1834137 RepID=UPI0009EE6E8F|nr:potassium channel family protein [Mycobacterium sp. E2699]
MADTDWAIVFIVFTIALVIFCSLNERGHKGWRWAEQRPRVWVSIFLLLMFVVFPLFYIYDRDGLAQTTGTQEPDFFKQRDKVAAALTAAVRTAIGKDVDCKIPDHSDIGCATVVVQDANARRISGTITFTDQPAPAPTTGDFESAIEIRESDIPSAGHNNDPLTLPYRVNSYRAASSPPGAAPTPAARAQQRFMENSSPPHKAQLSITPESDIHDVEAFKDTATGSVGSLGGQWSRDNMVRMVYFSAVTITTLGYGDIAPIETSTRIMVTAEAVLGAVTVGLFLNAIAIRPKNRERPSISARLRNRLSRKSEKCNSAPRMDGDPA